MTTPIITLANRLTLAREAAGISVNDMAAKLGVDRRTITSYEKQKRRPNTAVLYAYQDICEVPIEWLRGEIELTQEVVPSRCTGESPCQGTLFAAAA